MAEHKAEAGVHVWSYCLMSNHVHFVAVPKEPDSLSRLFGRVHRHYTRAINFRQKCTGHLWQERFHSFVMDEPYLLATVKYVELNPVKARLCQKPEHWPWSSTRAYLSRRDDSVVTTAPMLGRISDWRAYLDAESDKDELIEKCTSSGRPAGDESFISRLEALTGCDLQRKKPGPKPGIK